MVQRSCKLVDVLQDCADREDGWGALVTPSQGGPRRVFHLEDLTTVRMLAPGWRQLATEGQ